MAPHGRADAGATTGFTLRVSVIASRGYSLSYEEAYDRWRANPGDFWAAAADQLTWDEPWKKTVSTDERPNGNWFIGGRLNTCFNALDRHVDAGHGDRAALIYHSAMTDARQTFSYSELRDAVARFAGALAGRGVGAGDRVVIYMPMVPEAVVAMLACARLGAVHSVVFGGFAAKELASRIDDAQPKAILAATCGLEPGRIVAYVPLLDEALAMAAHRPEFSVVLEREQAPLPQGAHEDWREFVANAEPHPCVSLDAADPLYILYTSGTTGQPKGIVRNNGGHAVALHWSMHAIYGIDEGDVFWAASDIGWVVGHSYIVYGPLLKGATTILFEGKPVGTPDAGVFWEVIERYRVNALFTAPTGFRAIRREDPKATLLKGKDVGSLKALFLAGERCDPNTLRWANKTLQVPVIDHWWQTETGWAIAANPLGLGLFAVEPGSAGKPMPGWRVDILDDEGELLPPGEVGAIACRLPLPPGTLAGIWNAPERFREAYFEAIPGYYQTGDAGYVDSEGYLFVMTRTDDVINVAGHRLSTGAMEEVIAGHRDVVECAVTGVHDDLKGQIPVGFVCLRGGLDESSSDVAASVVRLVRNSIGPVAAFKRVIVVPRLPKTRSGKILRRTLRDIVEGNRYRVPATIDDPSILKEIESIVRGDAKTDASGQR